jgi:hypothetical protein
MRGQSSTVIPTASATRRAVLDGEAADVPLFDQRHRRLVDSACRFYIRLSPSLADTRGTNEPADSAIIHTPMIQLAAYRALTDG